VSGATVCFTHMKSTPKGDNDGAPAAIDRLSASTKGGESDASEAAFGTGQRLFSTREITLSWVLPCSDDDEGVTIIDSSPKKSALESKVNLESNNNSNNSYQVVEENASFSRV
jgi:hypothetical protein